MGDTAGKRESWISPDFCPDPDLICSDVISQYCHSPGDSSFPVGLGVGVVLLLLFKEFNPAPRAVLWLSQLTMARALGAPIVLALLSLCWSLATATPLPR